MFDVTNVLNYIQKMFFTPGQLPIIKIGSRYRDRRNRAPWYTTSRKTDRPSGALEKLTKTNEWSTRWYDSWPTLVDVVLINPKMDNLMVNSALDNSAEKVKKMVNHFENVCSKSPSTIADINSWTGRDLNPRPLACEASITTPELPAHIATQPIKSQYKTSR